jgi:hypothetical protein
MGVFGDFSFLMNLIVTEVKMIGKELDLPNKFIIKYRRMDYAESRTKNLGFTYDVLEVYLYWNL